MSVAISATSQASYPPRVALSVTGLSVSDVVTIYRVVGATRTAVRSADGVTVDDTTFAVIDWEGEFGVSTVYTVDVGGTDVASTSPAAYTLTGGKVALSDPISGLSVEVSIVAWTDHKRERLATRFIVGGRTVVVSGQLGDETSNLEVLTTTSAGRVAMLALMAGCTSGVVQVRQPGGYDGIDAYLAVTAVTERKVTSRGSDDWRVWSLEVAEVQAWPSDLAIPTVTLADIYAFYGSGGTLADLNGDYATLLDIPLGYFG